MTDINEYFKKAKITPDILFTEYLISYQFIPIFISSGKIMKLQLTMIDILYKQSLLTFIILANKDRIDAELPIVVTSALLKKYPYWQAISSCITE
jgi:hypothetical protein